MLFVAVLADFIANQCARCGAAHGAQSATKDGIACNSTHGRTCTSANLGAGGVGRASTQGQGCSAAGSDKERSNVHGMALSMAVGNQGSSNLNLCICALLLHDRMKADSRVSANAGSCCQTTAAAATASGLIRHRVSSSELSCSARSECGAPAAKCTKSPARMGCAAPLD